MREEFSLVVLSVYLIFTESSRVYDDDNPVY